MSGNREGGKKAATANKERHGADYYKRIGALGGSKSHPETRPFTKNPELARRAGEKGGKASKRGPAKHKATPHMTNEEIEEAKKVEETKQKGRWKWPFLGKGNR